MCVDIKVQFCDGSVKWFFNDCLLMHECVKNETTRARISVRVLTRHGGEAMCPQIEADGAIKTADDEYGPNDGSREVGHEIFERMYVLRCDGQWKTTYGDIWMGERRDGSLVAQTMQEFRNSGAGADEKVSGLVGRMLEECRFRA